jgi:Rps23 Pro-64 3,4-dihydroxylase Tpa1-like proline 4-hydroxylase
MSAVHIADHIGVFEGLVPSERCASVIELFQKAQELNFVYSRQEQDQRVPTALKADLSLDATSATKEISFPEGFKALGEMMQLVWVAYSKYVDKYDDLKRMNCISAAPIKVQRTLPSEGYHIWHHEKDSLDSAWRFATFIVYLNDVEDGGETEFLYQSRRVKPTTGTVVIFPATYTHIHRGNPPLSGAKYIATGWFSLTA